MSSGKKKSEEIKKLLEDPFWIDEIECHEVYQVHDDDSPDSEFQFLRICFSPDGDVWVNSLWDPPYKSIRKRTHQGGGRDLRTRLALMILAYAIKLDNEENGNK